MLVTGGDGDFKFDRHVIFSKYEPFIRAHRPTGSIVLYVASVTTPAYRHNSFVIINYAYFTDTTDTDTLLNIMQQTCTKIMQ